MRNLLILITVFITSCSIPSQKDLEGVVKNNTFTNKHLSVTINDRWELLPKSAYDEFSFLELTRKDNRLIGSISFSGFAKGLPDKLFSSKEEANQGLINAILSDSTHILVYEKITKIDDIEFLITKFNFESKTEVYQQIFYTTEIKDFYLSIIYSDTEGSEEEINQIVNSIEFVSN